MTAKPKYKICISGAAETEHCSQDAFEKAEAFGRAVAERGLVLVTGATTGVPNWAAKGAKQAGGIVIGLSPAKSEREHVEHYKLPLENHDLIIYTGFDYSGRNLLLTRSADAVVVICGRMGTLNEFTIAFEDNKPIGVLEKSGGTVDMIKDIVKNAHRGPGKIVYENDPKKLLDNLLKLIDEDKKINS